MGSFREEGKVCKLILSRVFLQRRREDFQHSEKFSLGLRKGRRKFFLKKDEVDKDRKQENFPLALINFPVALIPYLIIIGSVIPKK